jgi:flagellar motility protein MotE (MotC chaperone)
MLDRLRLLPLLIFAAVLLFGVKIERLWRHSDGGVVPVAEAQEAKSESRPADAAPPVQTATAEPAASERPRSGRFSPGEVEVLQKLAARREQLDARAGELDVRENLLKAAEKRLDEKIGKLKDLEARIQALLKQHDAEAEQKLRSLVKIYETMKPKDAAAIFEQLDIDILLDVVERMREQKMAPILANMNPVRAKEITVELAQRRTLPVSGG